MSEENYKRPKQTYTDKLDDDDIEIIDIIEG